MATASVGLSNKSECDNCREAGLIKDVVSFCCECDLHFCVVCDKLHGKIAPGHKTDFEENVHTYSERSSYDSCLKHSEEIAEYYCQEHESVMCKTCKQSEHSQCTFQDISTACGETDIPKEMHDTIAQLIKLQQTIDKLKREKQMTLGIYQSDIDERRYSIESLRKKFNSLFDRYDAQLESQRAPFVNEMSFSIRSYDRLSDQVKEKTKSLEESQAMENKRLSFHQMINAKRMFKKFKNILKEVGRNSLRCDISVKEEKDQQKLIDQLANLVHRVTESEEVVDLEDVAELDVAEDNTTETIKAKSFLNIKSCAVVKEADVRVRNDKNVPYIYGCCWLPDGQVILCDNSNNNIKVLDMDFRIKLTAPCSSSPYDVDCIDERSAVVTLPSAKALQFLIVKPGFKFQQKRDLNLSCRGVCVHHKNIFVCIDESEPSKRGVKILNLNGDDVSFISHLGSGEPRNLCVTADGTKIYYTGGSGKDVFINCVTRDGHGIFSVSSSELDYPRGIVHDENNIMICDYGKKCVQIISAEGVCGNILLTEKNNIYAPESMCLNKTSDNLIIASYKSSLSGPPVSKLTVYKLEYC